jgi:hypothetical protein
MAGVLRRRRPFGGGSVLPEPSSQEVYEGRLRAAPAVVGVNFLDVPLAAPVRAYEPVAAAPVQAWAPWCEQCRLEPVAAYTLGGAEYLARIHDALEHGGGSTARAVPAGAALAAGPVAGGAR